MPDETDHRVPMRSGAVRPGQGGASAELFEGTLIIRSPGQHGEAVHLPIEAVALYVDLRERRADRLPSALLGARAPRLAQIGTGPGGRGTVGLVLREPASLPAPQGTPWTSDPRRPDAFDVLVLDLGRQTEPFLAALGRRGPRRSPSLAAALVALDQEDSAGGGNESSAREMAMISTVGMVVVTAFALLMLGLSRQPTWLLLILVALPIYLYALAQTGNASSRGQRGSRGQGR